ncbi:DUF3800 domain-containing protein [Terrimonas rubra]|uniref:DUF3800 domain-containing protein n=1 Tax=Terrimonas rubra TaxID=1035890 RepID=A0ABW6A2A3_9BACT
MEIMDIRKSIKAMHPHVDFDVSLTFYYDETNNIKKLHLKKGDFNVDYKANFVLGGFCFNGSRPNVEDIFDRIPLQPTVNEVKLKLLATGEFADCLVSPKLKTFLENVSKKDIYLHISSLNLLYYSLVDIVQSALPKELLIFSHGFKTALYIACKANIDSVVPVLLKYTYPNVPHESLYNFVVELMAIIEPFKQDQMIGESIVELDRCLRKKANEDDLLFITDEEDHMLIKGLLELYTRPIYHFVNSEHIFDNEGEIKEQIANFPMFNNGEKLSNYKFLDSKTDKLIQASDVIVGLTGKFFKFINSKSRDEMKQEIAGMTQLQLENLDLFLGLFEKSLGYNQGLIHYTDSFDAILKIAF